MSDSINKLWNVIGIAGSRLTKEEKAQFIASLAPLAAWYSDDSSIWTVMQWDWEESHISEFPGTNPPLHSDNFEEVLGAIVLSKQDCWRAIVALATSEVGQVQPSNQLPLFGKQELISF